MTQTDVLTPAASRILAAASELFYARGIGSVGVDLIAEHAGTTKKTLYDRFGSKEGLVVAYLRTRRDRWQDFVLGHLDRSTARGTDRILVVLDALEEWMGDNTRGCGFINAYAELSGSSHAGIAYVREDKQWVRALYVRLVSEAGLDEPERRGSVLSLLHEGAIVDLTAGGDLGAIEDARGAARLILQP